MILHISQVGEAALAVEEALEEEAEVAGDTREEAEGGGEGQEVEAAVPTTPGLTRMARPESSSATARSSSLDPCDSKSKLKY